MWVTTSELDLSNTALREAVELVTVIQGGHTVGLSRADLFARIRLDRRLDPTVSQRALAQRYGVHRRTVRQALESAVPPPRKASAPGVTVLDPARGWIDRMLREDLAAPPKRKLTARRIHQRLAEEFGFDLASYSTVLNYVNERRPEIEEERDAVRRIEDPDG